LETGANAFKWGGLKARSAKARRRQARSRRRAPKVVSPLAASSQVTVVFADSTIVNKWRLAAIKSQSGNRRVPAYYPPHDRDVVQSKTPQGVLKERVSYGHKYKHGGVKRCK
jgi:hypothetical protein